MRQANPIPWKLVGQTICDANGDVVVSALNSCDVETRKMIVAAVNAWMECNPTNNKLREVLEWAKEKAVYIARHYRTPLSLTGNVAELLAYLDAALAVSRATAENSSVVGDCAKMREALKAAHQTLKLVYENAVEFIQPRLADEIIHTGSAIEAALAAALDKTEKNERTAK